ncbi:hypothetical protein ACFX2A_012112 [Malus domestica]
MATRSPELSRRRFSTSSTFKSSTSLKFPLRNNLRQHSSEPSAPRPFVEQILRGDSDEPAPLEPAAKPVAENVPRHFGF